MIPPSRTEYIVTRHEETRGSGSGASSLIPTHGAATSAIDQYRIVGIHQTNLSDLSIALTDVASVVALTKIAEGGISSFQDLAAAETALQALILHDFVHIIMPAPKVNYNNGLISYIRFDEGLRTELGFELFQLAGSFDWIVAPEFIQVHDGRVIESTMENSPLTGKEINDLRDKEKRFKYCNASIADTVSVLAQEHGVPLFLSDDNLMEMRRGDGFSRRFYQRMRISWDASVGDMPPLICSFRLPPLLAIVLNRLNNREDLKSVIKDLRDETENVRKELHEFNSLILSSKSQAEIDERIQRIDMSFDAIIPESHISDAQRRTSGLSRIFKLVLPIVKHLAAFHMGAGMSLDEILEIGKNVDQFVLESNAVIDRTVTAKTFAGLIKTESIQSLVQLHFTPAEITAIEGSL